MTNTLSLISRKSQNLFKRQSLHNSLLVFFLLFSVVWGVGAADEPVTFQASGPSQVILDRPFQISFTVNAKGKDFRLPEITDFDILAGPFESSSSSFSFINGKQTSSVSYKYTYTLLAKNTGTFTIPSASITVKSQKHTSNGLSIQVLPPDAPQQQNQGGQGQQSRSQNQSDNTAISNENLFIRTIVSKTNVYEQEAILMTYRLYSTLDVVNFSVKKMPDFKGFMKNDLEIQPQLQLENYNGRNYATVDLYQTVLFPQRAGTIDIEKTDFEVIIRVENTSPRRSIFDSFFDTYTNVSRNVTAPGVKINVNELPTANKPMAFGGSVGRFTMNSSISTQEIKANEAVTMKIAIEGAGNMRMIKNPVVKLPDSFEQYDPKVTNDFKVSASGVNGKKTVEYLFIPRYSGEFEIPSVEFCYFDIQSKSYKTLRTPSYKLNVLKAENVPGETTVVDSYVGKEDVKQLASDIRYIQTNNYKIVPEEEPRIGSLTSWLMYLIPLAICLLLFIVLSRQAKENANAHLVKNKKANKIARKRLKYAQKLLSEGKKDQFYDEVLKAVWTYLSDKLSIPVASLTKDRIESELNRNSVSQELVAQLMQILNTCEFARYAPNTGQQEMGNLFDETVQVISTLEEQIKKN
ncbi:BatD family protein [Paludibacter sp. 221]|uniref:BatD family protein n=1 Tax=Paludibacter sp. 221 TaxID=2302939 RepID=UPI0013D663C1|nr:BatD family protein [Paludibacter sp. 221]